MSEPLIPDLEQLFALIPKTSWLRNIIIDARGFCGVAAGVHLNNKPESRLHPDQQPD
jgi:hypothetical protein